METAAIVFWVIVPGRTNQTKHLTNFVLDSALNIGACMYVHINYRMSYFQKSILVSLASSGFLLYLMVGTFQMFIATQSTCQLIFAYYDKI